MVVESLSVEAKMPQKMGTFLEKAVAGWNDKGPTLGHIKPLFKGDTLQYLSLEKKTAQQTGLTTYTIDITSPSKQEFAERVLVKVSPLGNEEIEYQAVTPYSEEETPITVKMSSSDEANLKHRLIAQSRWGRETTYNPFGYLDMEKVPEEELLRQLELSGTEIPNEIKQSVMRSSWFSIDRGRIMVEMRNNNMLDKKYIEKHGVKQGVVSITDADDTIFAITDSHKKEYQLLSNDEHLHKRGVIITPEDAKNIYENSKITILGKAKEKRYTPKLNIALISQFVHLQEAGLPPTQAMEETLRMVSEVQGSGNPEAEVTKLPLDQDVIRIFNNNPLSDHMYTEYAEDLFGTTDVQGESMDELGQNMRIIATRGTVEGILGQVHKLHQLKLKGKQLLDQGVDMVIYTNDLKAETLTLIPQVFPYLDKRLMRIYDDNTTELKQYHNYAHDHHLDNLELIHVRHRGSKRFLDKYVASRPSFRSGDVPIPDDQPEHFPSNVTDVFDSILPFENEDMSALMQLHTGASENPPKLTGEKMYPTTGPESIDEMPDPLPGVLEKLKHRFDEIKN